MGARSRGMGTFCAGLRQDRRMAEGSRLPNRHRNTALPPQSTRSGDAQSCRSYGARPGPARLGGMPRRADFALCPLSGVSSLRSERAGSRGAPGRLYPTRAIECAALAERGLEHLSAEMCQRSPGGAAMRGRCATSVARSMWKRNGVVLRNRALQMNRSAPSAAGINVSCDRPPGDLRPHRQGRVPQSLP